jgi:hypothetical protein
MYFVGAGPSSTEKSGSEKKCLFFLKPFEKAAIMKKKFFY